MGNPLSAAARRVQVDGIRAASHASSEHINWREFLVGDDAADSGARVTQDTAMRLAAVFTCVKVISEDIAKLPLIVYQRLERGKDRATSHWLHTLLQQPNAWQTGFEFREMQQAYLELNGNFYALKTVVRDEVRELLPLPPSRVFVVQHADWSLSYRVHIPGGQPLEVPRDRMLHLRGLSLDGFRGLSPIAYQRETLGLAMQTVKYGAKMFKNGAMLGGYLKHPGVLGDEAAERLRKSFEEKYAGVDNAHKVTLLEEGTEFVKTAMDARDAQFIEARKYSRSEIAGIFRVPPHLIGDLERATFSNIEQQSRDYVQNGLLPRLRRIEARYLAQLLPDRDRKTHFVEHLVDFLMRGDYAQRMAGYKQGIEGGWMNRNEVRELENMNPGPKELDEFLTPLNMDDPSREGSEKDLAPGD